MAKALGKIVNTETGEWKEHRRNDGSLVRHRVTKKCDPGRCYRKVSLPPKTERF